MIINKERTMTNKEAIALLQKYYMSQDKDKLAYALAGMAIDIHRWVTLDEQPTEIVESLIERWSHMNKELVKFLEEGPEGEMTITIFNTDEGSVRSYE